MFERDWILGALQMLERDLHLGLLPTRTQNHKVSRMHVLRIGLCGVNESNCPKWLSPRNVLTLDLMMPSEANRKIGHIQDAIPHWGLYVIKVHDLIEFFLQFLLGSQKV
jgi:hypothetical protein